MCSCIQIATQWSQASYCHSLFPGPMFASPAFQIILWDSLASSPKQQMDGEHVVETVPRLIMETMESTPREHEAWRLCQGLRQTICLHSSKFSVLRTQCYIPEPCQKKSQHLFMWWLLVIFYPGLFGCNVLKLLMWYFVLWSQVIAFRNQMLNFTQKADY